MNAEDKWAVIYANGARRDLHEISSYITEATLEPDIAEKQIARITKAADSLDFMPYRHRLHYDEPWRSQGMRVLLVDRYIVFYVPDEGQKTVTISRVIHSARDIDKVLGEAEQGEKQEQ
jgi:toxin ParE1/3/4